MPDGPRYEDDFFAWTRHQAEVLRTLPVSDNRFDRERLAEEIEDLGKSERDAVRSQIRRIVEHLLKLGFSPAEVPRFARMATIAEARAGLSDTLTPSLRHDAEAILPRLYADGRRQAALGLRQHGENEAAARLPAECPYSLDEICRQDWYPPPAGASGSKIEAAGP
ncbi:MAG TPA: DUF29 domain-containing protein [Stellaceae bacterium]|nr:DUF29 domain-containing protein [Stellaceae bacterium]